MIGKQFENKYESMGDIAYNLHKKIEEEILRVRARVKCLHFGRDEDVKQLHKLELLTRKSKFLETVFAVTRDEDLLYEMEVPFNTAK